MKRYWVLMLLLVVGVFMLSTQAQAGTDPGTGITGSSHDLSIASKGTLYGGPAGGSTGDPDSLDRVCIYCHAPHHTISATQAAAAPGGALLYYPLWNHDLSTKTSYTMYANGTEAPGLTDHQLNAVAAQPGSVSKLCLSCHDGSVAISSYGNFAGASSKFTGSVNAAGRILIGGSAGAVGDLSNHHPIGFVYDDVQALDGEIAPSGNALGATGMTIADVLWGGRMECGSCHDVHNTQNLGVKLTWVQDTQSAFCFTCHVK